MKLSFIDLSGFNSPNFASGFGAMSPCCTHGCHPSGCQQNPVEPGEVVRRPQHQHKGSIGSAASLPPQS